MIGVVIPAHNEEHLIASCIRSVQAATGDPRLASEPVQILVVLDACTDTTATVAAQEGAGTLVVDQRNVGAARAAGAALLLDWGARWLSFTDAGTVVAPDWLAEQLALDADAVCGTVGIADWTPHGDHADLLRRHFIQTYNDADSHRHVHGANLGISADVYRAVGGFAPLACGEDVAMVAALEKNGARIAWSARPRVTTSARRIGRLRRRAVPRRGSALAVGRGRCRGSARGVNRDT